MWQLILKIVTVYLSSMLKFIFGPVGGYAAGFPLILTIVVTIAGMMTVVLLLTYFSNWFKTKVIARFFKKRNKFSARNRKFVTIWKRYGLIGVAALTPIFLTPIGGTVLAVSSGSPKEKIILYMLISASFWAVVFSSGLYFFGKEILKYLPDYAK
jgi:hypothetical protein